MAFDTDVRIVQLGAAQHGVFTLRQAERVGVTRHHLHRRVQGGLLERPFSGVYRIVAGGCSWEARVMSACLAGGAHAVASHRTAAALWNLTGGRRDVVEITVPRWRRSAQECLFVHEMNPGNPVDLTTIGAIPVTRPELTLLHLGALYGPNTVEMAYERARDQGQVTWQSCDDLLRRTARSGRNGVAILRAVLRRRDPATRPTQSEMETMVLQLFRAQGLPEPVTQFELRHPDGTLIAQFDAALPTYRIGIEYQSLQHHTTERDKARDRRRIRAAHAQMWDVLELGPDDVRRDPAGVAAEVRARMARASNAFGVSVLRPRSA